MSINENAPGWRPLKDEHNDKTSKPLQPRPAWIASRKPGESRWCQRGPSWPYKPYQADSHKRHIKVGKVVELAFTIEDIRADLPSHADWLLMCQFHGKNGPEDQSVGQVNISLRNDEKPNVHKDGVNLFYGVHGDSEVITRGGQWHTKKYKTVAFDIELDLPCKFMIRLLCGGDGETPAEQMPGSEEIIYPQGLTSFFRKTARMDEWVEDWHVAGSNYFPLQGKPDAGVQLPTVGIYCGQKLVDKSQSVTYSEIEFRYLEEFSRLPDPGLEPGLNPV